jgi:hypothetical protein
MEQEQLLKISEEYKPKNVYNIEHTGMFSKNPSNEKQSLKGDS